MVYSTSSRIHTLVVVSLKLLHTGMMEVLDSAEGSPHHSDMIPDCNGTETDLISCFSPNTLNMSCDYLLVECRDPVSTEPTATTATTATEATEATDSESDGSGGVSVAVFAGILGGAIVVIIAMILIITLLIVVILKYNNCRYILLTFDRKYYSTFAVFVYRSIDPENLPMKANPVYGIHAHKSPSGDARYTTK